MDKRHSGKPNYPSRGSQPSGSQGRGLARAPYNFVPLPEKVVPAQELPDHDCYHENRHSGYFTVTLTTETPLYIRGMLTEKEAAEQAKDQSKHKDEPDFFQRHDKPVIPGSSLRGMLRTLVEIIAFGKLTRVSKKRFFFRSLDSTAVGNYYRRRMTGKVETGFLRECNGRYFIKVCEMKRVPVDRKKNSDIQKALVDRSLYDINSPSETPTWNRSRPCYQHMRVWASPDASRLYRSEPKEKGARLAYLVITGNMKNKKREFLFYSPSSDAEEIDVPLEMIERFHDSDQITQWQQKAFPKDKPDQDCRQRDGMLRSDLSELGDPVFFLREEGKLVFFGRAGMFRLPYRKRPFDLIPYHLRDPRTIDIAEALFGFVRSDQEELAALKDKDIPHQHAGRVFVTDAEAQDESDWYLTSFTPRILSSPKPTASQHYLVQPGNATDLRHYDSEGIQIRGYKLYWHRGKKAVEDLSYDGKADGQKAEGTQYTYITPVKPQKRFTFRVYFENLTKAELGALLWVLKPRGEPEKTYMHKLGMGKPLGMGSVRLEYTLHMIERGKRYDRLFSTEGDQWELGESILEDESAFVEAFEQRIEAVIGRNWKSLDRIRALLKLMEWRENDSDQFGYMGLNEFKKRPILPDANSVG
jgi:CRISPR-associated protein (TIGR03986 family)